MASRNLVEQPSNVLRGPRVVFLSELHMKTQLLPNQSRDLEARHGISLQLNLFCFVFRQECPPWRNSPVSDCRYLRICE